MRCGEIILLRAEAKRYNKEYQELSHRKFREKVYENYKQAHMRNVRNGI